VVVLVAPAQTARAGIAVIALHIEDGAVVVRAEPKPRRPRGYALLRLLQAGICNTDIELLRGYYNFRGRAGHEFVAEVVACDSPGWVGKRVVGEINLACGRCKVCAVGLGRHCPQRTVLGIVQHPGAFAEYFTLPEANLHAVPKRVETRHAVFTEPVAAACEILDQVKIPKNERVAVLGDGKLGLLAAQVLQAHGARVTLYGKHLNKLEIARKVGVTTHFSNVLPRSAYNLVVEATGSAQALQSAIAMTRPRGTVVMKSTVHGMVSFDAAAAVVNEITLVGSRCGRFEPALKLIAAGRLNLEDMISDEFPLAEGPRAFARAMEPGVVKVMLRR
jgi:threonine dehydrogenase-like Zn-dependent dehydrogenase